MSAVRVKRALPLAVFLVGVLASLGLATLEAHQTQANAEARLRSHSTLLVQRIRERMKVFEYGLRGAAGVFSASEIVHHEEFRAYAQNWGALDQTFPGALGFGRVEAIPHATITERMTQLRIQHPGARSHRAGALDPSYVITEIEPFEKNWPALGFDMGSEPGRRATIEAALHTGCPTLSPRLALVQDVRQRPAFYFFLAIGGGSECNTSQLAKDRSLVYAPIILEDAISDIARAFDSSLVFQLYEVDGHPELLFSAGNGAQGSLFSPRLERQEQLTIGGRHWLLQIGPGSAFLNEHSYALAWWVALSGLMGAVVLALLLDTLVRGRARANRLVAERTRALALSEARLARAQQIAGFGSFYEDAEGNLVCTPLVYEILGERIPLNRNKAFERYVYPEDAAKVATNIELLQRSGPLSIELRIVRADGELRHVHVVAEVDSAGRLDGTLRDTTDSVKAQEQMRTLSRALEAAPECLVLLDQQQRITYVNPAFERIRGIKSADVLGRPAIALVAPDSEAVFEDIRRTLAREERWAGRMRCMVSRAEGIEYLWFEAIIATVFGADGTPTGYVAFERDIHQQVAASAKNALLRELADTRASVASILNDHRHPIDLRLKEALMQLMGLTFLSLYPRGGLVHREPGLSICMGVEEAALREIVDCFESSSARRVIFSADDSGAHGHYLIPLRFDRDIFGSVVLYGKNISQSIEVLEALEAIGELIGAALASETLRRDRERAITAAEQASAAKSAFLANMSHEIRTPMNGVLGMTNLLLNTKLDPEQQEALQTVRRSGEGLLSILNDILDISKIEANRLDVEDIPFAPLELLEDIGAMFQPMAQAKSLRIQMQLSELPPRIMGDPHRLRQIVNNLVSNAVKFTHEGTVLLLARMEAETLSVAVQDTGIGIPAEKRATIFEPFVQADVSTTRMFGGTGLGLAISRQLARLLGGELTMESGPNGSTFTLRIPIRLPTTAPEPLVVPKSVDFRGMRILVAEDNPVNQKIAQRLLGRAGCDVVLADDGQVAVTKVAQERFDLIFMDCQMPRMDGFEATQQIRAQGGWRSNVPIVAMTASAMVGVRERCVASGMNDYLTKPTRPDDLLQMLSRWVLHAQVNAG